MEILKYISSSEQRLCKGCSHIVPPHYSSVDYALQRTVTGVNSWDPGWEKHFEAGFYRPVPYTNLIEEFVIQYTIDLLSPPDVLMCALVNHLIYLSGQIGWRELTHIITAIQTVKRSKRNEKCPKERIIMNWQEP